MNLSRACGTFLALLFLTIHAFGSPTTLYPTASVFPLDGGGGGSTALLGGVSIEMFCDDFADPIYVPYGPPTYPGYTANVSTMTSGSNLSLTRFGAVASWNSVTISGDTTDSNTINGASALGRYQMAGYLVSLYHLQDTPSNSAYNDGIQLAIWDLLDPTGAGTPPAIGNANTALASAASWYSSTSSSARDNFLANFRIISDSGHEQPCASGVGMCPFQEQIVPGPGITTVPEPRGQLLLLVGLLAFCSISYRKMRCRA